MAGPGRGRRLDEGADSVTLFSLTLPMVRLVSEGVTFTRARPPGPSPRSQRLTV
jgi:hypothetical protein